MFSLLTIATILFAQDASVEKLEEVTQDEVVLSEETVPEQMDEMQQEEVAKILDSEKLENEQAASLGGMIEEETAQVLQSDSEEEIGYEEAQPSLEEVPAESVVADPEPLTNEGEIAETEEVASNEENQAPLGGAVAEEEVAQAEPVAEQKDPYETLPISSVEKQKIGKLLTTMAEKSIFKLLFERKHLERLGHEINHVHPIRFLGTVFSDPRLTYCMHEIRKSGFKWDGFIDGFSERFLEEVRAGNINAYIPGLAENLGIDQEKFQALVDKKDFEAMVLFLMKAKGR